MRRWYAWINSHGYFYQVIREMDSEGWITSRWLNEDTRSKRNYEISKVGKEKYNELTESIRLHLEGIHQF
ncbi:helix-turn-helix transcriptional regulator [Thalassobacillus sp. C254]|uniref:helix-turn-helix transcriptional regulator n=1 Tax=Thalassobacillus sp. C254 TaxID=1225341 RepID=UPI0006CF71A6|nr:helix-turn-helix transcriptional regulator [Thalassobacillus sp. C254]